MATVGIQLWELYDGSSCQVLHEGRTLERHSEHHPFSVGLSGRLSGEKHEVEVFFSGDCSYFGIGIAVSSDHPS